MSEVDQKQLDEQLCAAVEAGENDQIEKLIKYGANVHHQLDESDYRGSILNIAIEKDNLEVVKTLLRHKANPNGFPGIPLVPLSMCIMGKSKNCLKIAKELIANGAEINGTVDSIPLHYAGSLDLVKFLIENGADINAKNKDGDTALHKAAQTGDLDLAKLLIENGADVSATNTNGNTPLDKVHIGAKLDLVDILLKHGGKANRQGFYTQPLKEAVLKENLYLIRCSLQNGADVNVEDINRITPLSHCLHYQKNMDAVELIVDHIAKLEADGKPVSQQNVSAKTRAMPEIEKRIFLHNHKPLTDALLELGYKGDKTRDSIKAFLEKNKDKFEVKYAAQNKTLIDFVDFEDVEVRHAPRLQFCAAVSEVIKNNSVNKKLDDLETKQHQAQATGPNVN